MLEDLITMQGSGESPNDFPRFAYGVSYAEKVDDAGFVFPVSDAGTPTETDLLPDDEWGEAVLKKPNTPNFEYDVAVIGGGPAGYTAAIRAARNGAKTVLFEKNELGGRHLNEGGISAMTYLRSAELLKLVHAAEERGVMGTSGAFLSLSAAVAHKNSVIASLTTDVARLLRSHGVRLDAGEAVLKSAHEVVCLGRSYTASKIILCGGARTAMPQIPGISHPGVLADAAVLKLSEVPSRLLVLGGGVAGCEIAAVYAAFGSNVMLVEPSDRILRDMDIRVSDTIDSALKAAGAKIYTGISIKEISDKEGCPFVVTERGGVLCDKVVIASGRKADTALLGALAGEIAMKDGDVSVDAYLETSVPGVFAAGDITGRVEWAHAARRMAEVAAENALGGRRTCDLRAVPKTLYTSPEAASVGLTEAEALARYGDDLLIGSCSYAANTRAVALGRTEGFVKVLADRRFGEILGVHIVGADAVEMIAEPAALMRMEVTVYEVADDIIHASPTRGEAFRDAAADALGVSDRLPRKMRGGYDVSAKI